MKAPGYRCQVLGHYARVKTNRGQTTSYLEISVTPLVEKLTVEIYNLRKE
jgi:hypothetical protein